MNKLYHFNLKVLLTAFTLFSAFFIFGQVTIFNADFENSAGVNLWTYQNNGGRDFRRGTISYHPGGSGSYQYSRTSSNYYENNTDISATSPVINLSGYDKMTLFVDISHDTELNYDGMNIEFTNDAGANWHLLGKFNGEATNWYNRSYDASAYGLVSVMVGAWTGGPSGWFNASIDLPPQAFDNQSNIQFRVNFESNGSNRDRGVAFDNFRIVGFTQQVKNYFTCGTGIYDNLELWLNTETLALAGLNNGDRVSEWENTSALLPGSNISPDWTNAKASGAARPTFYDNSSNNVNYNPVVSFNGSNAMFGKSGFYSEDLYIVFNPTLTISASRPTEDVFLGDDYVADGRNQDVTGISINNTSARYGSSPDIVAYNQGSQNDYGKAIIHPTLVYDRPVIFNARLNAAGNAMDLFLDGIDLGVSVDPTFTQEENLSTFKNILNSRYWLGRSEYFGPSFTGDFLEVMSFSQRKSDIDRKRLESYLAVKYGITLGLFEVAAIGIPHVPGEYFDSNGIAMWNSSLDPGFTYNVTGIGRDDCSLLNQKQAKSVDPFSFMTVGLGDIYVTNSANPSTFESSGDFLMWGSSSGALSALPTPLEVTLGPSLVTTFTDVTERTWKFKELSQNANDIPEVKISIVTAGLVSLPPLVGNDAYVMIVADDENFTTAVETIFLETIGSNQEAWYDFDGTRYVKFGVAHEVIAFKDILFDGTNDYVAMGDEVEFTGDYSISAWVKTNGSNSSTSNKTIVSKRAGANDGYQFYLTDSNRLAMTHNGTSTIVSNTVLSNNAWRYVTFTYSGSTAVLYIDGVQDITQNIANTIPNDAKFCIASRYVDKDNIIDNFSGSLDEIRIFSRALSQDQIRFMMNQEIEIDGTGIKGAVIPETVSRNDISGLNWNNDLEAYFNMNTYIGTHLNDASGNGHRGGLIQPDNFSINEQTAPLPYVSAADGNWNSSSSWSSGNAGFIPGAARIINGVTVSIDWNIAIVNENITANNRDYTLLGLEVGALGTLSMEGDRGLTVTHNLKLDGTLDLQGESQLVQSTNSDLITSTTGKIEIDQQGTSDLFNYNYWSSPVSSITNGTNNNGFTISGVFKDGTLVATPRDLIFTSPSVRDGAPGTASTPATISGRWLYTYGNTTSNTYANWEYAGPNSSQLTGEGWTMKGTGAAGATQNYIFVGKPNNGDINLAIDNGNDYLVGNPYPSALDAHEFISDNPDTDGTVYFWEHWGGNTHILRDYQGGYATYNYSGGLGSATFGTSNPDVNQGGVATKRPEQFIPVGQGFFVTGINDGGSIRFRNDQRQFRKESDGQSLFVAAPGSSPISSIGGINTVSDSRSKIRLGFDSSNLIHRQLLLTIDSNATIGFDRGYDGRMLEEQLDDMAWSLPNEKLLIQGVPVMDATTELPLVIKINNNSSFSIKIDDLRNVAAAQEIFVKDALLNTYVNIMNGTYASPQLLAGTYEDRFFITFSDPSTLSNDSLELSASDIIVFTPENIEELHIKKSIELEIEELSIINMLGQQLKVWHVADQNGIIRVDISSLAKGNYIVKMNTNYGSQTRKVIIK
ncbi:LamG-like jellyroll fold domain-containing protein [Nonlabens sp.]|uniref:LamG-like jellyroll fold domain-containing protein n=1 Tax=Nonlabens sp. TaxID=1888209 RepID=UPI0025FAFC90|nr:LamG-like jellyroll fold domain-containing protein [Nonlabens sp.]